MKIEAARDAFISDYEVLKFMSQLQRKHNWLFDDTDKKTTKKTKQYNHPELESITRDLVNYLTTNKNPDPEDPETGTTRPAKAGITKLNDATFTKLMHALNQLALFKAEKLQIVNQLPTNIVHLYSIVEECDNRFSEDQIKTILLAVQEAAQL
ncbi:DNA-directed RNA polymerase III subunit RPC17 Ecym_5430 [Eremothecium cymbalariae DBVPG|uniref:DNA-directed RNA polymerase III subunit RPC9 n=1 Tax=Eremothecium cymbalariae (strain CBS 270.75 / DBVPG 7215 / KCTC 17166 / NRRL Y-17582) TaxID=931890 RepID=I6NDP2_ERECY|nr:hypothetical protein Ecym_5430 [Eremothecium cymbalariae DBVPG\